MNTKTIFFLLIILSATGFISPPIALCAGIIFGLAFQHPFATDSRALARFLLQASVVALGFGMNLHEVLKAGRNGFIYTAVGITFALLAGVLIGKILVMRGATSYLISVGTAIFVASFGGGAGIWHESPRSAESRPQRLHLHRGWHHLRAPCRRFDRENSRHAGRHVIFNFRGHRDLRWQCDCRSRADPSGGRRRDGRFTGHRVHSEFHRAAYFSSDRIDAASFAIAIRIVGGTGDSRYQFGRWRGFTLRHRSVGDRNDGEAGTCVVDCAIGIGDRRGATQQIENPSSLVHFTVLPGGDDQYLWTPRTAAVANVLRTGTARTHRHAFFNWHRNFARHVEGSRLEAAGARGASVDPCRADFALLHSHRLDRALDTFALNTFLTRGFPELFSTVPLAAANCPHYTSCNRGLR